MQGRPFLGDDLGPQRRYAFSARDRIDETEVRQRSVRGQRYHYIRNFTPGAGFADTESLQREVFPGETADA